MTSNRTGDILAQPAKDMKMIILSSLMILIPAFLYSFKSGLQHVFIITIAVLVAAFLRSKPLPYSDRPVIYCIVAAFVLTAIPDLVIPMQDERKGMLDILFRSSLTAPAFLYLSAFSCLFEITPSNIAISSGLSLSVLLICGDFQPSANMRNEWMPFLDPLLMRYRIFYYAMVAFQTTSIILAFSVSRRIASRPDTPSRPRLIAKAVCIALLPLLAIQAFLIYSANESRIRGIERYILSRGWDRRHSGGAAFFAKEVDLNSSLSTEMEKNKSMVILRAVSKIAPGYIRRRGYDTYQGGRWISSIEAPSQLSATRRDGLLSYNTFYISGYASSSKLNFPVQLFTAGSIAYDTLPIPGGTAAIDIVADRLSCNLNGTFEPTQWVTDGACTAWLTEATQDSAFQSPSPSAMPNQYLQIPSSMKDAARDFAGLRLPVPVPFSHAQSVSPNPFKHEGRRQGLCRPRLFFRGQVS